MYKDSSSDVCGPSLGYEVYRAFDLLHLYPIRSCHQMLQELGRRSLHVGFPPPNQILRRRFQRLLSNLPKSSDRVCVVLGKLLNVGTIKVPYNGRDVCDTCKVAIDPAMSLCRFSNLIHSLWTKQSCRFNIVFLVCSSSYIVFQLASDEEEELLLLGV